MVFLVVRTEKVLCLSLFSAGQLNPPSNSFATVLWYTRISWGILYFKLHILCIFTYTSPLHTSCLFSIPSNIHIVNAECPKGICLPTFVADNVSFLNYFYIYPFF